MIKNIHILGASGSGTTTLAEKLSEELGCCHLDTDNYFWIKTEPPYMKKRIVEERIELLSKEIQSNKSWVLSGSFQGNGYAQQAIA